MAPKNQEDELDLTVYAEKAATPLQAHFAEWIPGVTGYDPSKAKTKEDAFRMGVKLALNVHKFFQKSEENKSRNAELAEARAAELAEREEKRAEREAAKAEREAERERKAAEREAAREAREAEKAQKAEEREAKKQISGKAAPTKKAAAKKTAGKPTPTRPAAKKLPARPAKKAGAKAAAF